MIELNPDKYKPIDNSISMTYALGTELKFDAVWLIYRIFENGRGYFLTEPKIITRQEQKELAGYRNEYCYPAFLL